MFDVRKDIYLDYSVDSFKIKKTKSLDILFKYDLYFISDIRRKWKKVLRRVKIRE